MLASTPESIIVTGTPGPGGVQRSAPTWGIHHSCEKWGVPASGLASASQGESRSGTSGLTERTTPCARSPGSSRTAAALGTRQSAISGAI